MTDAGGLLCGVEIGGSKCVCITGLGPDDIRSQCTLKTESNAAETLGRIEGVLRLWEKTLGAFSGIGVASFGPLELRPESPNFGKIGVTPKSGWENVDVAGFFSRRLAAPVGITTDVIGAALAEGRWGAAQGLRDYAYVTVGTGVGVGLIAGGKPLVGWHHPELGHIRTARFPGDTWPGHCRFHGACVEGLAAGPAIEARTGAPPGTLPVDSPVWDTVAFALAQLAHTLVLSVAPQRILIGGGVAGEQPQLFARIRTFLRQSINNYVDIERAVGSLEDYITPPGLGALAGPLGALAVGADAAARCRGESISMPGYEQ